MINKVIIIQKTCKVWRVRALVIFTQTCQHNTPGSQTLRNAFNNTQKNEQYGAYPNKGNAFRFGGYIFPWLLGLQEVKVSVLQPSFDNSHSGVCYQLDVIGELVVYKVHRLFTK